ESEQRLLAIDLAGVDIGEHEHDELTGVPRLGGCGNWPVRDHEQRQLAALVRGAEVVEFRVRAALGDGFAERDDVRGLRRGLVVAFLRDRLKRLLCLGERGAYAPRGNE